MAPLLKRRTVQVRKTRELHRDARQRDGRCLVALVGYTNAGKSSLMNALSGSSLEVQDRCSLLSKPLAPQLLHQMHPVNAHVSYDIGSPPLMPSTMGMVTGGFRKVTSRPSSASCRYKTVHRISSDSQKGPNTPDWQHGSGIPLPMHVHPDTQLSHASRTQAGNLQSM